MTTTRWPERYGFDWRPDAYNSLSLYPQGPESPSVEKAAAGLTAEFEAKGVDLEAVVVDGQLFLRGPYVDDELMGATRHEEEEEDDA